MAIRWLPVLTLALAAISTLRAQTTRRVPIWAGIEPLEGGSWVDERTVRTARETLSHSTDTPEWSNPRGFERDVFTFTRLMFESSGIRGGYSGYGGRLGWWVDYPDADLNLSYRLQQLTSIRTDPDARVVNPLDPDLTTYPFLYLSHPENLVLSRAEAEALRRYLLNGGVMVMIDLWNAEGWQHFADEMAEVLPGRKWTDIDASHPLFHAVYDVSGPMNRLQVPTLQFWNRDYDPNQPGSRLQLVNRGPQSDEMHVRVIYDDHQHIMVLAIHNSDVSDGWEREGENQAYFEEFSEKISYPIGINLIVYLMTH